MKKKGDMANAKIFYTKACDLGDQVACTMEEKIKKIYPDFAIRLFII